MNSKVTRRVARRFLPLFLLSLNSGWVLAAPVLSTALFLSQAPARAQSAEDVAKVAQAITVRIEGATQGSGVLVKREGNRYTVLTAWHVVSGENPGEEVDIYTPDEQRHPIEHGSIKRVGKVDMAVMTFASPMTYELARVGNVNSIKSGSEVLVAGFPTSNDRKLKYEKGKLVANAAVGIDQGYQLLYTNDTVLGMSGGVVLASDGSLVGMHGRGELDDQKTKLSGLLVKTGTNQGIPITYYSLFEAGVPVVAAASQATTADDYLAQVKVLLSTRGKEQEVIRLCNLILSIRKSEMAYFYRAFTKARLGDAMGAISDYSEILPELSPKAGLERNNEILMAFQSGRKREAISMARNDIGKDIIHSAAFINRGLLRESIGELNLALSDYNSSLRVIPRNRDALAAIEKLASKREH